MSSRVVDVLSTEQCHALLVGGGVGRFVYVDEVGPIALPVNYAVVADDILFRIEAASVLRLGVDHQVAFEVDQIDSDEHSGWSVLLRGQAREVPLEEVPSLLEVAGEGFPKPWAAGIHNVWVRIQVQTVSGRRLLAPVSDWGF